VNPILDLHLHTRYSDGERSPEELVKELKANHVTCFSLTDHDNMAPFELVKRAALENDMYTFTGIEISSVFKGVEIHILGYQFDWQSPQLIEFIEERMRLRKERALLMFERLAESGFIFDERDVEALINDHYIGRPQIANLLYAYNYISEPGQAFCDELIGDASSEAITHRLRPVEEAIAIIKQAGGLVFVAHPGLFNVDKSKQDGLNKYGFNRLIDFGIDGIEVFHPRHTKSQIQRYLALAREKSLFISMGTDYHRGDYKTNPYTLNEAKYTKDVLSWIN